MLITHKMLADIDLCETQLNALRELIPHESFTAREAVDTYIEAGNYWTDIPQVYQELVNAGKLPDVGLVWKWAGIAFREQPERNAHLRKWANTLGPDNWREAQSEAETAVGDATYGVYIGRAAAYAAYAYAAAAYACAAVAYACAAAAYAAAVRADDEVFNRVKREILEMIIEEIERN